MQSVASAMLWELMVRGRWQIPGWFLFGNAFPILLYAAFSHFEVDFADPAFVIMHVLLLQLSMLMYGLGIVAAQGSLARLFLLPLTTAQIVVWHLLPGSLLLSLQVAVSLGLQNVWFGLQQPVLGPALFAAALWAAAQMLVGLTHRTLRSLLFASAPVVLLCCWFGARYGGWFQQPTRYWMDITLLEICTLLLSCVVCGVLTVQAIARDRCGERLQPLRLWLLAERWLERMADRLLRRSGEFRSATEAQLWYEWRSKGIALPVITAGVMTVNAAVVPIRLLVEWNWAETLQDFQEFALAGGFLLPLAAGLTGLLLGSTFSGVQSRDHSATIRDMQTHGPFDQMGNFLASRPISNGQYAGVILRTAGRSVVRSWSLWALISGGGGMLCLLTGVALPKLVAAAEFRWYLPGSLLGTWIGITCVSAAVLTGRFSRFSVGFIATIFATILFNLLTDHWASQQQKQWLVLAISVLICLVVVIGSGRAFMLAVQRGLLSVSSMRRCGMLWLLLTAAGLLLRPAELPAAGYPWLLSFTCLVFLPFAVTPLAIAWNRHR